MLYHRRIGARRTNKTVPCVVDSTVAPLRGLKRHPWAAPLRPPGAELPLDRSRPLAGAETNPLTCRAISYERSPPTRTVSAHLRLDRLRTPLWLLGSALPLDLILPACLRSRSIALGSRRVAVQGSFVWARRGTGPASKCVWASSCYARCVASSSDTTGVASRSFSDGRPTGTGI